MSDNIQKAAENGKLKEVKSFVKDGVNVNSKDGVSKRWQYMVVV
jgi:dihydroorotase